MILIDGDKMIAQHLAILAELGWHPPPDGDAIDQLARGELLLGDDAACVAGRDTSTIARWAQAAEDEGRPIGFKAGISAGSPWVYITHQLLGLIERKFGLHARREAETKLRKLLETRQRAQQSPSNARTRAASASETCDNIDSKLAHPALAARG
jgi:hypothetical protein